MGNRQSPLSHFLTSMASTSAAGLRRYSPLALVEDDRGDGDHSLLARFVATLECTLAELEPRGARGRDVWGGAR